VLLVLRVHTKFTSAALLSNLVDTTSTLDEATAESGSSKKSQGRKGCISLDASEVVSTYRLLLFFPIEYFTKSCRADFVKRAVSADWRLSKQLDAGVGHALDGLSVIRTYLKRTFLFLGAIEQQSVGPVDCSCCFATHGNLFTAA